MQNVMAQYQENIIDEYYDINNQKVILDNLFAQVGLFIVVNCSIIYTNNNLIIIEILDSIDKRLKFFSRHENKVTHIFNNQNTIISNEYDQKKKLNTILMWDLQTLQIMNCEVIEGNMIRQMFQYRSYIYIHQNDSLFIYDYMINKYIGSIQICDDIYDLKVLKDILIVLLFDRILITKKYDRNIIICDVIYKKPDSIEEHFKTK